MEQVHPWILYSYLTRQAISSLLWAPKVHYRIHKILPVDPPLIQLNPVHIVTIFYKIRFNIILSPLPSSLQ
jgi:hypothetical protein